jgi:hypothetical protein
LVLDVSAHRLCGRRKTLRVFRLSAASLREMKEQDPALAAQFYEFMTHFLAERVVSCNRVIRAFMD